MIIKKLQEHEKNIIPIFIKFQHLQFNLYLIMNLSWLFEMNKTKMTTALRV